MNDASETRGEKIEKRIDKDVTGALTVYGAAGALSIAPQSMNEVMEFAKMMSVAGVMIRAAFRNNPGACLGICMQSFRWGMDPFAVVNKAYIVKNKAGEEQIAYEAQLVHAVVNTRAPLKGRLKITYDGEGQTRSCTVTGTLKGETTPAVYTSPEVNKIKVQNSPLWTADLDQQLHYYSTRAWARRHVPEVILGVLTPDEIEAQESHYGPDNAKDITPTGPRPSRHTIDAPAEPAETYPLIDHTGDQDPESKATSAEQWAKELRAASAPTLDGVFTEKALGYLLHNADTFTELMPLIKDDALVTDLQARYAAAEEQRAETPNLPGGSGAVGDAEGSPAAATPRNEIAESTPATPPVAPPGVGQAGAGSALIQPPAVAPPVQEEVPPVAVEQPAPQPTPAPEKQPEGPKAIPMPMSTKTNKPDSAAYLIAIQKEMTEAASQPEHIDMILTREGFIKRGEYVKGSNMARIMPQTAGSIDTFAIRRKASMANAPQG